MTKDKLETCQKLVKTIDKYKRMYEKILEWKNAQPLRLQCADLTISINYDDCDLIAKTLRRRIIELETEFDEL